jgi:hypothetical protein
VRLKSLSELKRSEPAEIALGALPQEISMTRFAREKAFKISELVRNIYKESYEWYGFTIADRNNPEVVIDVGLPNNDQNVHEYTGIGPERIARYQESLPPELLINGWVHSHGKLNFQQFSNIDAQNHLTVLDYVTSLLRKPLAKREILVRDITLLVQGEYSENDLMEGSVSVVTDAPVSEVRIMETVFGGFSYGIVIGDGGWHKQEIYYRTRGILTGRTIVSMREAEIVFIDGERSLTASDVDRLAEQVAKKISPRENPPPERLERG